MRAILFILLILGINIPAQITDYKKAPNSYIYDVNLAGTNNYGGFYIPVKKAYEMWANYAYLKNDGISTPIPSGMQSASVYWEDVPGIIKDVSIVTGALSSDSKIKVSINNNLGNGNAVIAFKVNGTIYWSWHVWITDDPSNGVTYTQGIETDINNKLISVQYMDRNLGASGKSFLGDNWQKSGGLLYEWGRKDPFPPLVYKDLTYYEIDGEVGNLVYPKVSSTNTIPVLLRPYNEIEKNIQYSVKNPLTYLINSDSGNWFSSNLYKTPGTNFITWDLWSDNYKGGNGNANSSNATIKADSRSYELKSELDPCPNGWRVPSYYGRVTVNNNLGPWGRKNSGANDDTTAAFNTLYPTSQNIMLDGVKVYSGLGMDFTNAQAGARNIGMMPISGSYVYYPNNVSPNSPIGTLYQDQGSNGSLWSSTFSTDGARIFGMISDPGQPTTTVGKHAIYINQTNPSKSGNTVRCMKDPNKLQIGDFVTEYFEDTNNVVEDALNNPNTYLITNNSQNYIKIPVIKPFSVYNRLLTDNQTLPGSNLVAKVLWTNNPKIVTWLSVNALSRSFLGRWIDVNIDPTQKGIAVISLHNGSTKNPVYWSWMIWIPNGDPTATPVKYITEQPISTPYNFVNPTKSMAPPLATTFMDRNLGAIEKFVQGNADQKYIQNTKSPNFQWGRKDPIPTFPLIYDEEDNEMEDLIYLGDDDLDRADSLTYSSLTFGEYNQVYPMEFKTYDSKNADKNKRILENILFSINNPLNFLYQEGIGQAYDGGNKTNNNLSLIKDWVSDEKSQAIYRWGHGGKKSPFDPCPEGWRVPDVSFTSLYSGSKGNSPFYNGYAYDWTGKPGIIQDQWSSVEQYYSGTTDANGWIFNSAVYPLGNFAKDGIRGEIGNFDLDSSKTGIWTAAMADWHTGYALGMVLQGNQMQTGTGVYPQAAMSVRCAKDESRYLGVPITTTNVAIQKSFENAISMVDEAAKKINIYPMPFSEEIIIDSQRINSYEIFNTSGKLMQEGNFTNGKINTISLPQGYYRIKLTLKDGSVVSKTILKD